MSSEKAKNKAFRVDAGDIEDALKHGFPLTCASCVHFYKACAMGLNSCGKTECGGMILGRDFPSYEGPIPRSKFSEICLMCGSSELYCHVIVPGKEQRFALCDKHKDTFNGIITNPDIPHSQTIPLIVPVKPL